MTEQKSAREEVAAALKVSNPSLGYLGSYARIAIHPSEFSPELKSQSRNVALHAQ
jgi:hypothetical protein